MCALPGSGSTDMFRPYWFLRQVLSEESDKDDGHMSKESPVQSAPQPAPETLSKEIETLDDNEDNVRIPKLGSRVCGLPPQHKGEMGGKTPLNLSAAAAAEEAA